MLYQPHSFSSLAFHILAKAWVVCKGPMWMVTATTRTITSPCNILQTCCPLLVLRPVLRVDSWSVLHACMYAYTLSDTLLEKTRMNGIFLIALRYTFVCANIKPNDRKFSPPRMDCLRWIHYPMPYWENKRPMRWMTGCFDTSSRSFSSFADMLIWSSSSPIFTWCHKNNHKENLNGPPSDGTYQE